jgi:hypothetical protein
LSYRPFFHFNSDTPSLTFTVWRTECQAKQQREGLQGESRFKWMGDAASDPYRLTIASALIAAMATLIGTACAITTR